MCEYRNFIQNIPHLERPVIHDSANITYSYSLAVEELTDIKVPRRGQFIRALTSELDRMVYTLYWLAIYGIFLGHSTMFMWATGDRELFIDLLDALTGARVTHAFNIPGGVRNDLPNGFENKGNHHYPLTKLHALITSATFLYNILLIFLIIDNISRSLLRGLLEFSIN